MTEARLGPYELNTIVTGDARELAQAIPDESVDLIFTDPVYDRIDDYRWLAETAARVLKPGGWVVAFQYTGFLPKTFQVMSVSDLVYEWLIIWHRNNEMKFRYAPVGKSLYVPALVYAKDKGQRHRFGFDLLSLPVFSDSSNHKWSKPLEFVSYFIEVFTGSYAIVFDPFTGGGTVPAVCKMLGRNYLAFEIDPATANKARERVAMTQPPLFVVQPEQAAMELV